MKFNFSKYTNWIFSLNNWKHNQYLWYVSWCLGIYVFLFLEIRWNNDIFNNKIDKKHFDSYDYNTSDKNYTKRILGDATGELGPFSIQKTLPINSWYGTRASFKDTSDNLVVRGNRYLGGTFEGMFAFALEISTASDATFRIVITP